MGSRRSEPGAANGELFHHVHLRICVQQYHRSGHDSSVFTVSRPDAGEYFTEEEFVQQTSVLDNEVKDEQGEGGTREEKRRRGERSLRNAGTNTLEFMNSKLFKTPDVSHTPCIRRFLCEIETVIRTSDDFGERPSDNDVDRHPEEEVDVEYPDPQLELYTEAVRALYGYDSPSAPDSSPAMEKVLALMQSLTGKSCEKAYKLCPGRYTAPMVFKIIFNEVGFRAMDEL
ncbi:hypothetical protein FHG87_012499 [Trinorchestia longiramus]|nr:hypothetical protein FHG87_012499 [Trinorchestia longiramus]